MASIQTKNSRDGKKTFYVVVCASGTYKWLKAGPTLTEAKKLKRQVESLERETQIEKLGLAVANIRIDDFFQEYADFAKLHPGANSAKRYLNVINTFLVFLNMFHPNVKNMSQISQGCTSSEPLRAGLA